MKTTILILLFLHGLIHLMGFTKAFDLAEISELTLPITRGWGVLWLITSIILILSGILWWLNLNSWWIPAMIGILLSQILVFAFWQDARYGSFPNIIILIIIVSGFLRYNPPISMMAEGFATAPYEERYGADGTGIFRKIINPFEIVIEPMERLLLINIEKDPDSLYIGFEPQVFDDEKTGTGILVIAWRVDGKVDVYHQPSLALDPAGYDIAGLGLENMVSRAMVGAFFKVNEKGAQAEVRFEDIEGRIVELKLTEQSNRTRKPFGLLAPMGDAAENPSALPLILLHDFYFVRQNNTELSVKIDGREHTPDKLPLPIDFTRMTFARYCPDPLIVKLNPEFDGVLTALPLGENLTLHQDGHNIDLVLNRDIAEIQSISRSHNRHILTLTFNPAFPNLTSFAGESTEGKFEVFGDLSTGFIRGEYKVVRSGDHINIEMIPSGGWIPNADKLSLRFLFTVQPMFKEWPTTYRWTARLEKDSESIFRIVSNWERITAPSTY